jgi:hypothetical protein
MENGASPVVGACTLRDSARAAIQAGKLPNSNPDRIWGGRGVGTVCAICSVPVTRDEMEFEIEFYQNGDTSTSVAHHVHVRCFAAWEFERDNLALVRGGSAAP